MCPRSWRAPRDLNGVFRIVPRIDLTGFEHEVFEQPIVLRDGLLQQGATAWADERSRADPRPAPTPAMIQEATLADQQRLQGAWRLISGAVGGRPSDAEENASWTIAGATIVMGLEERRERTFTLDPSKSPRRIDIVATSSDGTKTEEIRGVYELRGDDLNVCLSSGDEPRPVNLRCSPGTGQVSFVLKRERP